ncbi:MAG: Fic family protein [Actinomycetota bacterium]|nr:Fic family protein [Actinomycetota bacterium]
MFRIPAAGSEPRPWRQRQRAGTREDRIVEQIDVTIPARIADLDLAIPADIAEDLDTAARSVAALDVAHGPVLSALSGLLLRTESVASSKIENISASVDDYARALHGSRANSSAVSMVAASHAMDGLIAAATTSRRIELEDLLAAHRRLMANDPGEEPYAGRVRDVQNWVGGSDYSPRGAFLVPPPPDLLDDLLADLLTFANRDDIPSLLQATIAHAQFETLHPFTDGNGRIGRALVNAILRARGTTSTVVVPIASALVARRDTYFSALDAYREGRLEPIVDLFSHAAFVAAVESNVTASRIRELPDQWLAELGRTRRGSAATLLLQHLLTQPVISAADAESVLDAGTSVAYAAIDRLESVGILRPLTDRKRNQVWGAGVLLDELADLDARIQLRARSV